MDIVEELRRDREKGARRLEVEYKAGLMSLARRFGVNESDAEELVNSTFATVVENIDDYMAREVLPHIPDAKAFFEENLAARKPVVKTGAEIPFTRYFYKYQPPKPSDELAKAFVELDKSVNARISKLFG